MFLPLFANAGDHWLDVVLQALASKAPAASFFAYGYNLRALLALLLVSLSCGAVGSLVVGGRMAFFSDALAHCAFASVSIGFILFTVFRLPGDFWDSVTLIMLTFGSLIGCGIVAVRERTGLASDTVIGVFFAGGLGLAAMLRKIMQNRKLFSLEDFLFGDPLLVHAQDVVYLAILAVVVAGVLLLIYNYLLLVGFSSSLALSRGVPARLASYAFIVLLALVVNLSVRTVRALLINALLVVPAATAANVSRNMRQLFWLTIGLCLFSSLTGQLASWEVDTRLNTQLGTPGTIILVSVSLFVVSALLGPWLRNRPSSARPVLLPNPSAATMPADPPSRPS